MHQPVESITHTALITELKVMGLIGTSDAANQLREEILTFAKAKAPILIVGDTGSGKELVARALHYLSTDRGKPFVPVNCAAISEPLFEKEFFGAERGAYTDAREQQVGLLEQAHGGTLFLDEINSVNASCQAILLRFLENGNYRRIGGKAEKFSNAKIIAASNQSIEELQQRGGFRQDLLYRLDVVRINVPSLQERTEDLAILAQSILQQLNDIYATNKHISEQTIHWIQQSVWPGNIRQLKSMLHRQYLKSDGEAIEPPDETLAVNVEDQNISCFKAAKKKAIDEFEREYLTGLLTVSGGNVTLAAHLAGKERRCLGRLLSKHNLDKTDFITHCKY